MNNNIMIKSLSLTFYYFNPHDREPGDNVYTIVSVKSNDHNRVETVKHFYRDFNDANKICVNERETSVENDVFKKIEALELNKLSNNYFTDSEPYNLSYWIIEYNDMFKICGTFNNQITKYTMIKDILKFDEICKEECLKVNTQFEKMRNNNEPNEFV